MELQLSICVLNNSKGEKVLKKVGYEVIKLAKTGGRAQKGDNDQTTQEIKFSIRALN